MESIIHEYDEDRIEDLLRVSSKVIIFIPDDENTETIRRRFGEKCRDNPTTWRERVTLYEGDVFSLLMALLKKKKAPLITLLDRDPKPLVRITPSPSGVVSFSSRPTEPKEVELTSGPLLFTPFRCDEV